MKFINKIRKEKLTIDDLPEPPKYADMFQEVNTVNPELTIDDLPEVPEFKKAINISFNSVTDKFGSFSQIVSSKKADLNRIIFITLLVMLAFFLLTGLNNRVYAQADGDACSYDSFCTSGNCDNETNFGRPQGSPGDQLVCYSLANCAGTATPNCGDSNTNPTGGCQADGSSTSTECDDYAPDTCFTSTYCDNVCGYWTLTAPTLNDVSTNTSKPLNSEFGKAKLTWTDNSNGESTFEIHRSTDNSTFTAVVNDSASPYQDDDINDNTAYFYKIRAVDSGSSCSGSYSAVKYNITSDRTGPESPRHGLVERAVVLYYDFDENSSSTVIDKSAFGNDGDNNGATWSASSGYRNGGMSFNGNGDVVNLSDVNTVDGLTGITIETWVYVNAFYATQNMGIVGKSPFGTERSWILYLAGTNFDQPIMYVSEDGGFTNRGYLLSDISLNAQTWYHLVATWDNSDTFKIYINGTQVTGSKVGAANLMYSNLESVELGQNPFSQGNTFNGTLDNLKIYDTALTSSEISLLYNQSVQNITNNYVDISWTDQDIEDGLVLYMPFEENQGTDTRDWSDKKNDGKLVGGVTWISGKYGSALDFDGTNGIVNTEYAGVGGSNPRTIMFWERTNYTATGRFLGWGDSSTSGEKWHVTFNKNSGNGNLGAVRVEVQGGYQIGISNITDNQWHFIAVALDGSNVADTKIYVDGLNDSSSGISAYTVNTDITSSAAKNVTIGAADQIGTLDYLDGFLDEVRIYNRSLSQREIIDVMQSGLIKKGVFRSTAADGTYSQIASQNFSDTNYTDNDGDTADPNEATGLSSSSHSLSTWSNDNTVDISWTRATDNGIKYWYYIKAFDDEGNENNYFGNPSFEKSSLQLPFTGAYNGVLSLNTTDVHSGSQSLQHSATGADSSTSPYAGSTAPVVIGSGGKTYRYTAWAKSDTGTEAIQLYIFCLNSTFNWQEYGLRSTSGTASTTWQQFNVTKTCPGGADYVSVRLDNDGGSGAIVFWDDVALYELRNTTVLSGLDGYDIACNQTSADHTGTTKDYEETQTTHTCTFPDNASNYFHIVSLDNAGNWGSTSADIGPFYIDTTPPTVGQAEIFEGRYYYNGTDWLYNGTIRIRADHTDLSGVVSCNHTTNGGSGWALSSYNSTHCFSGSISPSGDITINLRAADNASNLGTGTSRIYLEDGTAPSCIVNNISESSAYAYYSSADTTIYYNNVTSGSFSVNITAIDSGGAGVNNVTFPALITLTGSGSDTSYPYGSSDVSAYDWDTASSFNDSTDVTCFDNLGNFQNVTYNVTLDISDPSGGSVSYTDGIYLVSSVSVDIDDGTDKVSGVNASGTEILRRTGTLTQGSCSGYGAWSQVGGYNPSDPYVDSVSQGNCYQYRYQVFDYVNNRINYTSSNEAKINTPPAFDDNPIIIPTDANESSINISCVYNTSDGDGDPVYNITNWYIDNVSIMLLNTPFEGGSNSTDTKDYASSIKTMDVNGATYGNAVSHLGGAYFFDGNDDICTDDNDDGTCDNTEEFNITGDFTAMAYVNRTGGGGGFIMSSFGTTNNGGWGMLVGGSGEVYCRTDSGGSGSTDSYTAGGYIVAGGGFMHVAIVKSGTSCRIYVNGTDRTTTANTHTTLAGTKNPFYIGARGDLGGEWFTGYIDEVMVFNRSMSAAQISKIYNESKTGRNFQTFMGGEFSVDEEWKCEVTPNDGYTDGTAVNSSGVVISQVNSGPYFNIEPNIVPASTNKTQDLYCNFTATDDEGDTVRNITNWYVDDVSLTILNMPFEGGTTNSYAKDYSGRGNDMDSSSGSPVYDSTGGRLGTGALVVDGNDYLQTTDGAPEFNMRENFSVSIWFSLSGSGGWGNIMRKNDVISVGVSMGTPRLGFQLWNGSGICGGWTVGATTLDYNEWYHVVYVYNSTHYNVYLNGTSDGSGGCGGFLQSNSNEMAIGGRVAASEYFNGTIDEILVFNRSLTLEEIHTLYNYGPRYMNNSETNAHEDWYCNVTLNDGTIDGEYNHSSTVTIQSTPPVFDDTPEITPVSPIDSQDLTCNYNVSDSDGDTVHNITTWYVNNRSIAILHMPFEGGTTSSYAKDYSGRENSFTTSSGSPSWNRIGGRAGSGAISFDGASYLNTEDGAPEFNMRENFSVSIWFSLSGSGGWGNIMRKNDVISVGVSMGTPRLGFQLWNGSGICGGWTVGATTLDYNEWYHVVYVYNSTHYNVYLNGTSDGSGGCGGFLQSNSNEMAIGGRYAGSEYFNGTIDEIIWFNQTLTQEQIHTLYNYGPDYINNSETTEDEEWICSVTPNDGYVDGTTTNSSFVTILSDNNPPVATNVEIQPTTAYNITTLDCNATVIDAENTTMTVEWWWYNQTSGSQLISNGNTTGVANNTNTLIKALGPGNTTPGETWNCTIRAYDGETYSSYISATKYIYSDAPTHDTPYILPSEPNNDDTLTCYANNSIDPDGGTVVNITNWYLDDTSLTVLNMPFEGYSVNDYVRDYSGYDNNGNYYNTSWGSTIGRINGAYYYDGNISYILVNNSDSVETKENFSIDVWIKLNSSFSAYSHAHDLTILDKGEHRLELNYQTGQLEWTLINKTSSSWTQLPELPESYASIWPITEFNGSLYVGTQNSTNLNGAQVYKYNGTDWETLPALPSVYSLTFSLKAFEGKLWAALGSPSGNTADVYYYDGTDWTNSSLNNSNGEEVVYSLEVYNDKLYAGLGYAEWDDGDVWVYNSSNGNWTKSMDNADFNRITDIEYWNKKLYATGLPNTGSTTTSVFEFDGSTWTDLPDLPGSPTTRSGWSLEVYQGNLYLGTGDSAVAGAGDVYYYDGSSWTQTPELDTDIRIIYDLEVYNGNLWAAARNSSSPVSIWYYDGSSWTLSSQLTGYERDYILKEFNGKLYVGVGNTLGDSDVWVYGESQIINSSKTSWDTNWHHIVALYNTTDLALYIDNSLDRKVSAEMTAVDYDNSDLIIGNSHSNNYFGGIIDELRIFNRSLTTSQIGLHYNLNYNQIHGDETNLYDIWNCSVTPNDLESDGTTKNSAGVNVTDIPRVTALDILPSSPNASVNLDCNATVTDAENSTLTVEYWWYNQTSGSELYSNGNKTGVSNNTNSLISTLSSSVTSKSETWNCTIRAYDGTFNSGYNSTTDTIGNSPPTKPTLITPTNGNLTYHDRTPFFNWSSTDADGDSLTYTINITFESTIECGADLSEAVSVGNNYTGAYAYCVDQLINWTVRAYDGTDYSEWSDEWNFTIESFLDLNLTTTQVELGELAMLDVAHTDSGGGGSSPLILENTGNIFVNITRISANASLFTQVGLNTQYFQYKADNDSTEAGAFNWSASQTSWADVTDVAVQNSTVLKDLNWNDTKDNAEIDIRVQVPLDEPPGDKRVLVYLIGEQG